MEIIKKQIGSKTQIYLTNVPQLNEDVYSFLKTLSVSPKLEKLESGLYNLWVGAKAVKSFSIASKIDDYNLIKIFIESILKGIQKNVWSEAEQSYVDIIDVNQPTPILSSNISKKSLDILK